LLLGRRAVQFLTVRRGVTCVELDTGQRVSAKTVASAIDGPTTFQQLLGHLTFFETTATAVEHPSVHRMGPIYGWSLPPAQFGPRLSGQ
jgi:hypothetical protein